MYDMPLISVVISAYNYPELLKVTLESVLNQTHSNIEVLVIDDGSEIDLYPVIEMLSDQRIVYYKLEHTNANVARNYGIQKSRGEYIAMLDSDDRWLGYHLESCLSLLENAKADGLYGSLIVKDINIGQERAVFARPLNENESMVDYLLSTVYGAQTSTLFMKVETAQSLLWDVTLQRHQDYDYVIRYSKRFEFIVKKEPTAIYVTGLRKQRSIDFESCIKVIQANKADISPAVYHEYHLKMLRFAMSLNAPDTIIAHYKKEAAFFKEYVSYHQYLLLKQPKSVYEKFTCKLAYIFHILRIGVE